jgi:parallel beta-helix repeat protein
MLKIKKVLRSNFVSTSMNLKNHLLSAFMLLAGTLYAPLSTAQPGTPQTDFQKKLQRQLILAEDGDTIRLDAGTFMITGTLSLEGKNDIVVIGAGIDRTILSFRNQTEGAEGLRVSNGQRILLQDFTVQDAKGDAIKTMNLDGVTFRRVRTEWTGEPKAENGAYGLYPVLCTNVLIEECEAIGASDAGIYVGQSKRIIVRNCRAYHNVAGIEIENSQMADVYNNEATENTGGILVFDLPDLVQKKGGNVRVFKNKIHNNNFPNFAPEGNIVATVPQGTGVLVLATNDVEIFENEIINNNSIGTGVISYYLTEKPLTDSLYYPYPTRVFIHNNRYQRERVKYQGKGRLGLLFKYKLHFGRKVPDIVFDGILDDKKPGAVPVCVQNNENASFVALDAAHNFKAVSRDASPYDCSLNPLKEADLTLR